MIQVTKKDQKESSENLVRRFNRKVQQSGVLSDVKANERFAKPLSKTERRKKAIIQKTRRDEKIKAIKLGQVQESRRFR